MSDIAINLTQPELRYAAMVGMERMISALAKERNSGHGYDEQNGWQVHVEGACGECAVAKYFNVFWSGSAGELDKNFGDVGKFQVRTTPYPAGKLIVHPSDADEHTFLLVTGGYGQYVLRGWTKGRLGKNPQFWGDPTGKERPAYWVPQSVLYRIDTLAVVY